MVPIFIEDKDNSIFFAINKINGQYLCFPKIVKSYKGKNYNEWYKNSVEGIKKYYHYLDGLDEYVYLVDESDVVKKYNPLNFVSNKQYLNLNYNLDVYVSKIIETISNFFNINIKDIGIEGSILLGNYNQNSDIDILVYGKENAKKIQENFSKFDLINEINFFDDVKATEYVMKRINCGYGATLSTLKKQFLRRYYGFIDDKQFSIICVPYENECGYINLERKIINDGIFEGNITIVNDDNSCVVPSIYEGIDTDNQKYTIEIYNHYGINQLKIGEQAFIRAKKYIVEKQQKNVIILGFWNNTEERLDLNEKQKLLYR